MLCEPACAGRAVDKLKQYTELVETLDVVLEHALCA